MRDTFKFEKGYWYPHMKPNDIAIWERFIDANPNAYNSVQYDYNVGNPPPFNTLMDDGEDLNQDALYRRKIDVVARLGARVDIIEIKPNAGPATIGQIKAYKALYIRDESIQENVNLLIITDKLLTDMEYLCKLEGVKIVVV